MCNSHLRASTCSRALRRRTDTIRPGARATTDPAPGHGERFSTMTNVSATWHGLSRHRLGDLVSAAAYGTILVLAALSVLDIRQVGLGYSAELIAGVGVATWVAHIFAELL